MSPNIIISEIVMLPFPGFNWLHVTSVFLGIWHGKWLNTGKAAHRLSRSLAAYSNVQKSRYLCSLCILYWDYGRVKAVPKDPKRFILATLHTVWNFISETSSEAEPMCSMKEMVSYLKARWILRSMRLWKSGKRSGGRQHVRTEAVLLIWRPGHS